MKDSTKLKCKACHHVTEYKDVLKAPSPFLPEDTLKACPACKLCDEGFYVLCDEPGCMRVVSCGWFTGDKSDEWGGYRRTCREHWPEADMGSK